MKNIRNLNIQFALFLACFNLLVFQVKSQSKKPNILFIAIDDLRPQLNVYGHNQMITPNLDALASEGRLFKNHYVQVPTCGPSRAVMLTGKNLKSKAEIQHHHLGKTLTRQSEPNAP